MSLYWGADFQVTDTAGASTVLRLPATGMSIKKTMQADGTWAASSARRLATWATGSNQQPISYFDALCGAPPDTSASPKADSSALT